MAYRGLLIGIAVFVGVVLLGFGALVGLTALGSTAKPQMRRIPLAGDPGAPINSSPGLGGQTLDDPIGTIEDSCERVHDTSGSIYEVPEVFPFVPGGEDQYVQVVRREMSDLEMIATVDLDSGEVEKSPATDRLVEIGRRSTVVVCVGDAIDVPSSAGTDPSAPDEGDAQTAPSRARISYPARSWRFSASPMTKSSPRRPAWRPIPTAVGRDGRCSSLSRTGSSCASLRTQERAAVNSLFCACLICRAVC